MESATIQEKFLEKLITSDLIGMVTTKEKQDMLHVLYAMEALWKEK